MPKAKGIEKATAKDVEIIFDVLNSDELQNELKIVKDVFKASYGPAGRLHHIQNVAGGHVTVTSSSARILNGISTVSSPITRLLLQAVRGHLSSYSNGGLFTGLLILELVEAFLKSSLPRHIAVKINSHALNFILDYLQSSDFIQKIHADVGNMQQVLCVIKSILGSKPATGMSPRELESLAILLLRGFLNCIPSSGRENNSILLETFRIHCCEGPATSESCVLEGVLLDVKQSPEAYLTQENKHTGIKIALFDSSLSGNVDDMWFDKAQTELSNLTTSIEQNVLEEMMSMVDSLIENGVKLVACQKVIHPTLQRYLTRKGLYVIERLSIRHIHAVQRLTGAKLLSSFQGKIDCNSFGSLEGIKEMVINQKRYLHLIPHPTSQPISTLMLCAPDETALDELNLVCTSALDALKQLVFHPFLLPGGGCFETNIACFLIKTAQTNPSFNELGCTKGQYCDCLQKVASAFLHIAQSLDHDKYDHLVDSKMHHHWISQPLPSLGISHPPELCTCGLLTSDTNTEWYMTEELLCKPREKNTKKQLRNVDNLRTEYENATLDVMSMKINAIKTAFETANVILRIKHFVKEKV